MLPPGHIAAGFLTAKALLHYSHSTFSAHDQTKLLWWGVFFGFAPDLDTFYSFAKSKAFKTDPKQTNHRKYYSHAPVLWLIVGLLIYFTASSSYIKYIGLLLWLASWSHFLLDSIQYGIMWLWPLNMKVYALFPVIQEKELTQKMSKAMNKSFIGYWITFIKEYAISLKIVLVCEIVLLVFTLILYSIHII